MVQISSPEKYARTAVSRVFVLIVDKLPDGC